MTIHVDGFAYQVVNLFLDPKSSRLVYAETYSCFRDHCPLKDYLNPLSFQ